MDFTHLALVALLVEAIIQTLKPVYDKEKGFNRDAIFSLLVGIAICLLTGVDFFAELGLPIGVPYVGAALTGVIASRGSNVVHDVFKFVQAKANPVDFGGVG